MTDGWSSPSAPAPGRGQAARGGAERKRKMIEVSVPTHAAVAEIGRELTDQIGRTVTMAEVVERLGDHYRTGRLP